MWARRCVQCVGVVRLEGCEGRENLEASVDSVNIKKEQKKKTNLVCQHLQRTYLHHQLLVFRVMSASHPTTIPFERICVIYLCTAFTV
jgi:hypothetical protein